MLVEAETLLKQNLSTKIYSVGIRQWHFVSAAQELQMVLIQQLRSHRIKGLFIEEGNSGDVSASQRPNEFLRCKVK